MKSYIRCLAVLIFVGPVMPTASALLIPFSEERIESLGDHCVHGYDGNFGQVGVYYTGDSTALSQSIAEFVDPKGKTAENAKYATMTLTLRVGPMVVPSYVHDGDELSTDWEVQIWSEPDDSFRAKHINVNVWLGDNVRLKDLEVPPGFVVKSGGEIEDFIAKHQADRGNRITKP